jgi:hypothetical protein
MIHELTFPYAAFMVYLPTKLGDFYGIFTIIYLHGAYGIELL